MTESSMLGQGTWLTFTVDHDVEQAVQRFVALFGKPPEYVLDDRRFRHPALKVGPAPDEVVR